MFDVFHNDIVEQGLEPIMKEQTYRWLYSMIALVVIPGAIAAPICYRKLGIAMSCVLANLLTACTILVILYVALSLEPTTGTFAACTSIIYFAFPFTLISVMSTGPMLDRIAPIHQKGFAQGLYGAVMDGADAVFPLSLGLIADKTGQALAFWICIGLSILAAIVNFPLIYHPLLQKPKEEIDDDRTVATIDEEALEQRLQKGEFVPSKDIWAVNLKRLERGDTFLYTHVGTYTPGCADDINIPKEEYMFLRDMAERHLGVLKEKEEHKRELVEALNFQESSNSERAEADRQQIGEWMSQYLVDNGYRPGEHCTMLKAMTKSSFPRLSSREVTIENVETRMVRIARLMNDYMEREGLDEQPSWFRAFSANRRPR